MRRQNEKNISPKVGRILNGILIVLSLILIRIWHLSVIQHDDKVKAAEKPARKKVIEKADRAPIVDRFGIPLAVNKVQYNVSVSYGGIRLIPRSCWDVNAAGKKIKRFKRKEYIEELSKFLSFELSMPAQKIEDIIHSKAATFGNIPCLIKENIDETTYLRLKVLEKDYPGLLAEKVAKRCYPQGPVGADVIGYLGAISREEHHQITHEIKELQTCLNECEEGCDPELPKGYNRIDEVLCRLKELEGKAYKINDQVGKAGIEKAFDEDLRGSCGFKTYLADTRGNFLKELNAIEKKCGHKLTLTLSKELQEYAERLLTEYEKAPLPKNGGTFSDKQPWIKGGAIVAMCPRTGQVYALATHPRFDPNDFISVDARVHQWLENENYIAALWNQKLPLRRERFDAANGLFYEEEMFLGWKEYLEMILTKNSSLLHSLENIETVDKALKLQKLTYALCRLFKNEQMEIAPAKLFDYVFSEHEKQHVTITLPELDFLNSRALEVQEELQTIRKQLDPFFVLLPQNLEKLLLVDLTRLIINGEKLSADLEGQTISDYREFVCAKVVLSALLKRHFKEFFSQQDFAKWRETHFQDYLLLKRKEESDKKRLPRPFVEYLDEVETAMFKSFWEEYGDEIVLCFVGSSHLPKALLHYAGKLNHLKSQIDDPHAIKQYGILKAALEKVDPKIVKTYLKTAQSYEELNAPLLGSYAALRNTEGKQLLKDLAASFYSKRGFGFARSHAFRQASSIGSVFKLVPAYEALRQRYDNLVASGNGCDKALMDLNPLTIIDDKRKMGKEWRVGFTTDHRVIPRYYRGGCLPRSEHAGVGEVDIVKALAASSNPYFALLAGDVIADPEDLCRAAHLFSYGEKTGIELPGEIKGNVPSDVIYNRTGLYSLSIGQHSLFGTPLQTAVMLSTLANGGKVLQPKIVLSQEWEGGKEECTPTVRREIFLPKPVRDILMKGLKAVIMSEKGTGRVLRQQFPEELLAKIVGKTSTAESLERLSLDVTSGKIIVNHISFGAIYFDEVRANGELICPSLVVVVYLRFGEYGNRVAPYAVKVIQKWLEIQKSG